MFERCIYLCYIIIFKKNMACKKNELGHNPKSIAVEVIIIFFGNHLCSATASLESISIPFAMSP